MNASPDAQYLTVSYDGKAVARLGHDSPRYSFGSGADVSLRLDGGRTREHVSRHAGSIGWHDGVWMIYNDSESRPFDVVVDGVANPVHPRITSDARSIWALGPKPAKIQIAAGTRRLHLLYLKAYPEMTLPPPRSDDSSEPTPPPFREASSHERLLLAAKFLSLPEPGEALRSNGEAAQYVNAALPPDTPVVTKEAVANVVYRWRLTLRGLGVQNLDDDGSLGRQLLAWGVIRQEDRHLLRPWGPGGG